MIKLMDLLKEELDKHTTCDFFNLNTTVLPNEPVPPVINKVLFFKRLFLFIFDIIKDVHFFYHFFPRLRVKFSYNFKFIRV